VMAISVISVSSDSSEDSVGTLAGRVILFGIIPTTIPNTTPVITPPTTQTDTTVIPTEIPIIAPTVPPLPAISQFLSSTNDTTDSDTPDTPPSPTHGMPFIEITSSTQRSPVIPRHRVMILAPGQPIPHVLSIISSNSLYFAADDVHLEILLQIHHQRHHQIFIRMLHLILHRDTYCQIILLPIYRITISCPCSLIPSPKRVRDFGYLADVEVDPRETSLRDDVIVKGGDKPHLEQDIDPGIQAEIDECFAYADALRDRGIDARVVVEAVD
ncbi:hypothetical protein Tco_1511903, partial [Tanacetum coccineum]